MLDREATIFLNLVSGIGYARFAALCETFGSAAAALGHSAQEYQKSVRNIGPTLAQTLEQAPQKISLERELEMAEKAGIRMITLYDTDYPDTLRTLSDPPLVLYCRGVLPENQQRNLGIVGSRRMSAYGKRMTESITTEAVEAGYRIISGLAFGVDGVAHQTTLDAGGVTIGVLGGGLLRIHPQEHLPLAERMVEAGGALLSEFPLEFPVNRQSFPRRNRIVAGLSQALVVIEAGEKSGALITANMALEQGKAVFAVPGRADEPQAKGSNGLIKRNEAKLIESFQDILDDFEFLPGLRTRNGELFEEAKSEFSLMDDLAMGEEISTEPATVNESERLLCRLLAEHGPSSIDHLVALAGMNSGNVMGTLLALEMRNIIRKSPNGVFALV